jgi:hypothetical protein
MSDDVPDLELMDVSRLRLDELLNQADESALVRALNRVLCSTATDACNGFQASI